MGNVMILFVKRHTILTEIYIRSVNIPVCNQRTCTWDQIKLTNFAFLTGKEEIKGR
jgi:hypothetical protein